MSLAALAKETKRKRKSTDSSAQSKEAKRPKKHESTSKSSIHTIAGLDARQGPSNHELTPEIITQMALTMTTKPFPNPENQGQTLANQAWRKQELFRKRNARTQEKRGAKEEKMLKEGVGKQETEATEEGGKEATEAVKEGEKKQKKPKIDRRKKIAKADIGSEHLAKQQENSSRKTKADKLMQKASGEDGDGSEEAITNAVAKPQEKSPRRPRKDKRNEQPDTEPLPQGLAADRIVANRGNWAASKPAGGQFINHDAVFSIDEKFLLLATSRGIHVYSASESLLVRTLPISDIVTYALSPSNPNFLYVATSSSDMVLFDWTTGKKIKKSSITLPISAIAVVQIPGTKQDTLFTIQREDSESGLRDHVTVQNISSPSARLFFVPMQTLRHLKVLNNGGIIIAASQTQLCIGTLGGAPLDASTDFEDLPSRYVWRTLKTIEPVNCLDVQTRTVSASGMLTKQRLVVDLVFGNLSGKIVIYEDVLFKLEENEKLKGRDAVLKPIVNHWHREAPATVKWSLDGNYVISGGKETVLCLWQRETSRRQLLPHLTSAIESLAVSPSGASYAVQLADNSVMVLSTSELQPTTNIAGLQSRFVPASQSAAALHTSQNPLNSFVRTPAVGNPRNPKQLIMAVPTSQIPGADLTPPAPFLQVFDVYTSRHVSRQALTRNIVTSVNIGPEGNKVREPNVTLLQVSADGRWLATIEEWSPPTTDIVHMAAANDVLDQEARRRRETYLKFWRWNDEAEGHWALDTRIDFPHQSSVDPYANRVFDLVSNPTELSFATIGEDAIVRVWKPKTRLADGRIVRGARDGVVSTWTCYYNTGLDNTVVPLSEPAACMSGKLAYSNDGSILAAIQNADSANTNIIHFLNASNGTIHFSESAFHASRLLGMGFIDRYFIALSDELRVWDLVANKLVYGFKLDRPALSPKHMDNMSYLAINSTSNTFAIAIPNKPGFVIPELRALEAINLVGISTSILVFDPRELAPLFSMEIPGVVTALADVKGAAGFFVLDAQAEVRVLGPKISAFVAAKAGTGDIDVGASIENENEIEHDDDDDEDMDGNEPAARIDDGSDVDMEVVEGEGDLLDGDKHVVAPEKLAGLFNGLPSFAMPSVKNLFYDVVGLYARKKDEGAAL